MTAKTKTTQPQTSVRIDRRDAAEGRAEVLRRAALRRRARHLMRADGFTDADIAVVIGSTPEGVHKAFYRDALKGIDVPPAPGDDDGVKWED